MRQKIIIFLVGVLVAGISSAADISSNTFENGATVVGAAWTFDVGVSAASQPGGANNVLAGSVKCLNIPIGMSATNAATGSGQKVWTDFYTIPQKYFSYTDPDHPAVEAGATAQFFVNDAGQWVTMSGADGATVTTHATVIGGGDYPTVADNTYYHVSILTDYGNGGKWSFFVNNLPLAVDLTPIDPSVTAHGWVRVQNLSGSAGATSLDDCRVSVTVPPALAENVGPNIPMWVAATKFGTVTDPRPTNTSVTADATSATWSFDNVAVGATYKLLGTANPSGAFVLMNGGASVDLSGNSMTRTEINPGSISRYFYKLVRISADGTTAVTNSEIYAAYKQPRVLGQRYITGVPVNYVSSAAGKIGGSLGDQLMLGLTDNYKVYAYDTNGTYRAYSLSGSAWSGSANDTVFYPGSGLVIVSSGAGSSPMVFAGTKPSEKIGVKLLANGWTYASWAADDHTVSGGVIPGLAGATPHSGDYFYYQGFGSNTTVRAQYDGSKWVSGPFMNKSLSLVLRAGDGFVYRNIGAAIDWVQN